MACNKNERNVVLLLFMEVNKQSTAHLMACCATFVVASCKFQKCKKWKKFENKKKLVKQIQKEEKYDVATKLTAAVAEVIHTYKKQRSHSNWINKI